MKERFQKVGEWKEVAIKFRRVRELILPSMYYKVIAMNPRKIKDPHKIKD